VVNPTAVESSVVLDTQVGRGDKFGEVSVVYIMSSVPLITLLLGNRVGKALGGPEPAPVRNPQTTMTNPPLPPEILDSVIDFLHDQPETLQQCCLVSKSWIPRTRRHLFADIKFHSASDIESWKKTFLDVTNSPARHARTLFVGCPQLVTASDAEEGGWIRAFSGVASLDVDNGDQDDSEVSLAPFYRFAPTLKSLCVYAIRLPHPQVFDFIYSLPLLEDLSLTGYNQQSGIDGDPQGPQTLIPSTSPSLTGFLDLAILGGVEIVARQLLDLPNGPHFRNLKFLLDRAEDIRWITELMIACSRTLTSLDITCSFYRTSVRICVRTGSSMLFPVRKEPATVDLSKVTRLRDAVFRPGSKTVDWITMALQTITPEHRDLRQISVYLPYHLTHLRVGANSGRYLEEETSREWVDLDHFLVQFWELRSIRPRVGCARQGEEGQNVEHSIGFLLPEATKRGIIDSI